MQVLPFTTKIDLQKNDYIMVYRGQNAIKINFFCYIRCNMEGYTKLQNDFKNKISDMPSSYGEVIYYDEIENPDIKAEEFLENYLQNSKR
jgi:hypothetical protein